MSSTSRTGNIIANDFEKAQHSQHSIPRKPAPAPVLHRMMTPSGRHPVDYSQTPIPPGHRKYGNPVWFK